MRSAVGRQASEATSIPEYYYTSISSYADAQIVTVTVTHGASPATSSGTSLITAAAASSSLAVVYIYPTSVTEPSSPKSTSSSSSSSDHNSSLSPGVVAGIVIGSLAFLIALILIVFCTSRKFARRKRRETSLDATKTSRTPSDQHQPKSVRSQDPPHELATQYNQLEMGSRGRPFEMVGSHLYPAELQAGSTTDLSTRVWKLPPGKDYISPGGQEERAVSHGGACGGYLSPGTWETVSSGGESGSGEARLSTTTLQATSTDHSH